MVLTLMRLPRSSNLSIQDRSCKHFDFGLLLTRLKNLVLCSLCDLFLLPRFFCDGSGFNRQLRHQPQVPLLFSSSCFMNEFRCVSFKHFSVSLTFFPGVLLLSRCVVFKLFRRFPPFSSRNPVFPSNLNQICFVSHLHVSGPCFWFCSCGCS